VIEPICAPIAFSSKGPFSVRILPDSAKAARRNSSCAMLSAVASVRSMMRPVL